MDASYSRRRRVHHHARHGSRSPHSGVSGAVRAGSGRWPRGVLQESRVSAKLGILFAFVVALAGFPRAATAQLDPSDKWYTIETSHFRVHFPRELEITGKAAAAAGERAWKELSTELKAPKGKVDLVVADNVDYINGYATPFPSNRIVIFAHPPFDALDLRNYDDWLRLVITHELTHVFHLDRAGGLWRVGRSILGRHPGFFPNAYLPSWIIEGLATYYESRVTGAGRLEGPEHFMVARADAEAGRIPRPGELSSATTRFPGGGIVYQYGSLFLDHLSRTRGAETIPQFVERTSRVIWPITLNGKSKGVFGVSFDNAWREWSDSLRRSAAHSEPLAGWRDLTRDGYFVSSPQWMNDTTIIYSAANWREVPSAYTATLSGKIHNIGRRNSLDPNVPVPDGSIVYAQPDYIDPFHYRNDLWIHRNGEDTKLTHGARLSQPDVRADGMIVAVQEIPGSSRIVRVSRDGKSIVPMIGGDPLIQYAEPSFSPDGRFVAAIQIGPGNRSAVIVMRDDGTPVRRVEFDKSIVASPSWSMRDSSSLLFTSNATASMQAYLTRTNGSLSRLTQSSTGFFSPEMSPDGRLLAGITYRADGYHLGVAPFTGAGTTASTTAISPRAECTSCVLATSEGRTTSVETSPVRRYSPWRSMLPTYWEPVIGSSTNDGFLIGAATNGEDIIGRHSYFIEGAYDTKLKEAQGYARYQYGGFGQPFLLFSVEQDRERFGIFSGDDEVGKLLRRNRIASVSASFTRPRARTFASLVAGADVESRLYTTDPDTLLTHLSDFFSKTRNYPSVFVSGSWSNTKRPPLAISREDGVVLTSTARQRWEAGEFGEASRSITGVSALYRSIDLPGFAHHVVALRAAGGYADDRALSTFSVGGLSGGSIDIIEGYSFGGERRTFGVRGFSPSTEQGIRALAATLEYRAPIRTVYKRAPIIPLYFDRVSASVFGEAGRAFCPASADQDGVCRVARDNAPWLASVGAELDVDTAIQYDFPARIRLGFAAPVSGRTAVGADAVSAYLTVGASF